ncbi:MAG: GntR family transcriptional regulator [Lachnospiraceae bacterium]|jgi:DNA-binding GntR family transcriptional regulator|nr:GntR family transcriptional regulator [Lachnospiraceae bacterium]
MEQKEVIKTSDKYSLQGMVFDRIRENILTGVYKKDDELREVALGKELGVSRTPVREALRQLELEGLVQIIPNKGAVVIGISSKDFRDIYEMRGRLEGLCARWAAENATDEDIAKLEEIMDLAEYQVSKGKYDKVLELDNEFHILLYNMADSKMLFRTLSGFHHYLESLRKTALCDEKRVINSVKEHRAIVDSIKARDPEKAEKNAIKHMKKAVENIEKKLLW